MVKVEQEDLFFVLSFSANFKKVSNVASSSPIILPSLEIINECVSNLVDTHPSLVLLWCQVLRHLKYKDAHFWCGFIDSGTRLSTGGGLKGHCHTIFSRSKRGKNLN